METNKKNIIENIELFIDKYFHTFYEFKKNIENIDNIDNILSKLF